MHNHHGKTQQLNSINFNLYKVIMAIPFFNNGETEEEEEPTVESVQQQEVVSESEEESLGELLENESSFVGQLLQELVGVYSRLSNDSCGGSRSAVRSRRVRNNRINVPPTLPDLLCCHAQNLHPISNENDDATRETLPQLPRPSNNRPRNNRGPRTPQTQSSLFGPASTDGDLNSDLSLDVKMNIDFCYKRIGQDLRQIADRFETTSAQHRQRRCHPAGNQSTYTEITFKSELAIKIAIPVALFGLSLAFLNKSI